MVRGKAHELKRVNKLISERLIAGDLIAVFPEGVTTFGEKLERFHASLLQPGILAHAKFWPLAIRYTKRNGENNREVAYVGDTSLIESVWAIVGQKIIYAELIFCEAMDSLEAPRQVLARKLECAIASALNVQVAGTVPEKSRDHPPEPQSDDHPIDTPYLTPSDLPQAVDPALTNVRK